MDNPVQNLARLGMIVLATARATRFITSDFLGEWTLVAPAKRWSAPYENEAILRSQSEWQERDDENTSYDLYDGTLTTDWLRGWHAWYEVAGPLSKQARLTKGLDCPFCVGFWIGGVILLGEATIGRSPLRPLWRFGIGMLGLNYLVGHISSRIDG
ncbi:hypothetical protein HOT47_gp20 [Microbacterium phage Quhwah]|uniref:DUF1360 domain-containing protein n=1 Tax=Microbacterium phage Quhwah TaxID=2992929 RepID=A0A2Z4QA56_9CAUD|nr:hypothetical protein HOT47_gp20 [Microbacterium phage Quhwah]AWY06729.1 hypothetical protein SEA_QUHWAH_20 [Microbacterium phage Quhwah]